MEKPSIVDVVGNYLPLRRCGKEYRGPCPFHADKTPSFYVSEELGVFYCFGCGEKGDVIDFLMKWSGKTFVEVCDHLDIDRDRRGYVRMVPDSAEIAARRIYEWTLDFSERLAICLCEIGQRAQMAKDTGLREEFEISVREWTVLADLHDDLANPDLVVDLFQQRDDLERLIGYAS